MGADRVTVLAAVLVAAVLGGCGPPADDAPPEGVAMDDVVGDDPPQGILYGEVDDPDAAFLYVAEGVAVVFFRQARVFDRDGNEQPPLGDTWWVVPAPGGVLLEHDWDGRLVARDAATRQALWATRGKVVGHPDQSSRKGVAGDRVVVCALYAGSGGQGGGFVAAVALEDGGRVWQVDEPCWPMGTTTDGEVVLMLDPDALDQEAVRWLDIREFSDGALRHRVHFDTMAVRSSPPLTAGGYGVLRDLDGGLILVDLRTGDVASTGLEGWPIGTAEEIVLLRLADGSLQAFDPSSTDVLWHEQGRPWPPAAAGAFADAMFIADGSAGELTRRDPHDGSVRWSAQFPGDAKVTVAGASDAVYVGTTSAVFAFGVTTGEQRWWIPLVPDDDSD